ncbi:MAG: pyridoxal phosphate-dependent aminotransferase [Acidobacteriota bacterium]|nr:pyridoxal phosphate-dependent aminotransferase [Acidobacteriota bacterium]
MTHRTGLSERAARMPASPIRRLAPLVVAAEKAGKHVYGLNIGQPDIATPAEILARLATWKDANIPYGPSQGLPEFVEALRAYYEGVGLDLAHEEIFVTTGGSEALLFVIGMIADPGDEILVFEPFYTNYSGFSAMLGVRLVPVTTHAADGYHLPDVSALEEKVTSRTRAIIICSPNNPTGTVYHDDELERLAELCRRRGLYLIADEVYREFTYDGRSHRSVLTLDGLDDRAVVVDSLSKRVSLCGIRIGCIVTRNRDLMAAVLRCGQARLCPPTLGQYISAALGDVPASYIGNVIAEYEKRRDVVYDALSPVEGVTLRKPEGAFYLCPKLPIDDGQRFAEFLLEEFSIDGETVMIAPADGFYATPGLGRDEVRIAYVLEEEKLRKSMNILTAAMKAYPGRSVAPALRRNG